ncbi:ABC transporter permease [Seleniivibrio sp.]|uniref:ABC transporter permease n=1 Tax=Seleniivibrio sp. TaxID=2898801 RepID=UPI0025F5D5B8|nr:ABC transporter permease [Seleniivibrio sp.]MCD8552445.1 ABC transporter permease [Seleniivibrio sp.]
MKDTFCQIWRFRYFIIGSVVTGFRVKFARSRLGGLWGVIAPLCQSAVYALVLSSVLSPKGSADVSYAAYLLAGTLGWAFFSDVVLGCVNVFTDNAGIIKKVSFPSAALPLIAVGTSLINAVLFIAAVGIVFAFIGQHVTFNVLWLIPLYLTALLFALGFGAILGILNVFIRDIKHMMQVVLQFWFWLTPVVYMESIIPAAYRHLLKLNPMYPVVTGFQDALVFGRQPEPVPLLFTAVFGLVLVFFSLVLHRKAAAEMADVL